MVQYAERPTASIVRFDVAGPDAGDEHEAAAIEALSPEQFFMYWRGIRTQKQTVPGASIPAYASEWTTDIRAGCIQVP